MKVGIIHYSLRNMGGGEFVCLYTIKALQEAGHEVYLYTGMPTDWNRTDSILGSRIRPDKQKLILEQLNFVRSFTHYKKLLSAVAVSRSEREVDLTIDTHGGTFMVNADIVYMHFPETLQYPPRYRRSILRTLYFEPYFEIVRQMEKSKGSLLIANSDYTAYNIKMYLKRNTVIINPPVNIEKYRIASTAKRSQDAVLSISRYSSEKNLETIPEVARKTRGDISFYITGTIRGYDDTYTQVRKKTDSLQLHDRIFLSRDISDDEKLALFSKCKVFLHLIKSEHFGIAPVEAMSAGLIPVVHRSGGQRFVCPEEWQYDSIEEIPKLIGRALDAWSPELASKLSKDSEKFSVSRFEKQIVEVSESVARKIQNRRS